LWYPIISALQDLPDTKQARAEYVTDLSEYRQEPTAHRSTVFVVRPSDYELGIQPIRTTWFVPCHARRPAPMKWYPGMPIKRWEPSKPSGLWANALDLISFRPKHAGKTSRHPDNLDLCPDLDLRRREANDLANGRRWFFGHSKHGTMLSSPVIRREYQPDGMFHPEIQ
jgi:hypothetical protein